MICCQLLLFSAIQQQTVKIYCCLLQRIVHQLCYVPRLDSFVSCIMLHSPLIHARTFS